jgi:hypothetical protein
MAFGGNVGISQRRGPLARCEPRAPPRRRAESGGAGLVATRVAPRRSRPSIPAARARAQLASCHTRDRQGSARTACALIISAELLTGAPGLTAYPPGPLPASPLRKSPPPKPPSSNIEQQRPLSNPTPVLRPWPRERVFMPRSGHSVQQKSEFLEGWKDVMS